MTDAEIATLRKLAGEMIRCVGMPPEWIGDWDNISKRTPKKTKRHIEATAKEAQAQCREWGRRIIALVDHGGPAR